jgi:bromodomain-containing factor 1
LQRRESSRMVKLPSRLEEDDPDAQLSRALDKCAQILKIIREKDIELGAFFSEPVDPVALGIPTYFQIVREPMDLRTINRRLEANEIDTPEEFARLTRLVFENAMTFNIDPAHSVHQAARDLLVLFNQKFRDVERTVQTIRRTQGIDVDETGRPRSKDDKKRRRLDGQRSLKRIRLEEAQAMSVAQATALASLTAAATTADSSSVTRHEFNLLVQMIQELQQQVVLTHTALADLTPDDDDASDSGSLPAPKPTTGTAPPKAKAPIPVPEKKKAPKRKSDFDEPVVNPQDSEPLSHEEQEFLTETINDLPQEHIDGVIQIIREATQVGADETELDLEIDQLDNKTQRKLLRHVQKVSICWMNALQLVCCLISY